jgi:hypothetical protein
MGIIDAKQWYGARTLYRHTVECDQPRPFLVEQRVVLVEASSFEDAIDRAESEALSYASQFRGVNSQGQAVRVEYLGSCNVYSIDDALLDGVEVHSQMTVHNEGTDDELSNRFMGSSDEAEVGELADDFLPDLDRWVEHLEEERANALKPEPG